NGNTTYIDTHTLNVTNLTQLIPEIWYFAGNSSINPFYSPVLIGNFTVTTFQTIAVTTTTTSSTSSSTLPHANLTLYLRNSTGVELYKNITALTNESINITSVFPYPADVNMTLFVMDYQGINQSRNISKSFLQNFTTFWTPGDYLINITWEGNLTLQPNSTAFYVTVLATTTTTSTSSSSSSLPKANLTLYLRNSTAQASFTGLYTNITAETNQSVNITSKEPYPADVNMTLYVMDYAGVNQSRNISKSFLQNITNFWTEGNYLINITWEGNLTLQPNSTAFYVTVLATTTTTSTSSSSSSLPKANLTLYLRNATAEVLYRNITIETNQSLNITSKDNYPYDANMTLFVMNYTGGIVNFNYSKSFLQNLTTFWTNGSFLINITWEGNLTFIQNSTAFYVDVLSTTTTTSSSSSTSTTSSTTTSSTTASSGEPEVTPGAGGGSSSGSGGGKTFISNIEHKAGETVYTFSELGTIEPISIDMGDPYMLITNLRIELNKPINNAEIKVTKTILPKEIPNTDKILEVFQIIHENLPDSFISKAIFTFKIPKDTENVALFKYDENSKSWNEIQMIKTGEDESIREVIEVERGKTPSYSEKIEVEASKELEKEEVDKKSNGDKYEFYQADLDSLSIFAIAVKKESENIFSIKPMINRLSELKLSVDNYFILSIYIGILLLITSLFYLIFRILKRAKSLIRTISNILICLVPLLIIYLFFVLEFDVFIFGVLPIVIISLTVLLIILAVLFRRK
ncbi:MAG: hypothetical protein AABX29_04115, partial [Nanoarchaeota archaeon]